MVLVCVSVSRTPEAGSCPTSPSWWQPPAECCPLWGPRTVCGRQAGTRCHGYSGLRPGWTSGCTKRRRHVQWKQSAWYLFYPPYKQTLLLGKQLIQVPHVELSSQETWHLWRHKSLRLKVSVVGFLFVVSSSVCVWWLSTANMKQELQLLTK